MPRNDEGEFELVLGNRQLLSGFFIVVVLFGIFFTMGYIVGRHSSPAPLSTTAAASQDPVPIRPPAPPAPAPGQAEVLSADKKAEPAPVESPAPETVTRPATAPPRAPRPAERPPDGQTASSGVSQPVPGNYLQVSAPKRTAADAVIESLKNKGIAAVLAPGPNEDTVRVLVGPLDSASIGKMRVDLESAGFKPFAKKY